MLGGRDAHTEKGAAIRVFICFGAYAGINMSLPGIIAHESAQQGGAMLEIPVIE